MVDLGASPVFVIPHHARSDESWGYLERTVGSLFTQSDRAWRAVIVDDASPGPDVGRRLEAVRARDPERLVVLRTTSSGGPGAARNRGVSWAAARGAPFVLFLDADDLAHPHRLRRTRRVFAERPTIDFVYSGFTVIDEHGQPVPEDRVTPSIREILDSHRKGPPEGPDAWITIGTELGYTSLTSTVATRIDLATRCPFPATGVAEDDHTWLRMSAAGTGFAFLRDTEAGYRVPSTTEGSATRAAVGSAFYWASAQVTADGFARALVTALARGRVDEAEAGALLSRFHDRLAETMAGEGRADLAAVSRALAHCGGAVLPG
ncbi:glycosyltransferase [Actinoalloteichus spitiensis]|uniref:glycosyltransferase n=1 Tax=Actinoalloteichus spitiensis TaxID=252394 RepID=UPI000364290B|nr:glycosyltransferase family 2 protein [Actinoalloteichus spitiensis]